MEDPFFACKDFKANTDGLPCVREICQYKRPACINCGLCSEHHVLIGHGTKLTVDGKEIIFPKKGGSYVE